MGASRRAGKEGWSFFGQNRWSGRQRSPGTITGWPDSKLRHQCHAYNRKITRHLLKMHLRLSALNKEPEPAGIGLAATTLQEQSFLSSQLHFYPSLCGPGTVASHLCMKATKQSQKQTRSNWLYKAYICWPLKIWWIFFLYNFTQIE